MANIIISVFLHPQIRKCKWLCFFLTQCIVHYLIPHILTCNASYPKAKYHKHKYSATVHLCSCHTENNDNYFLCSIHTGISSSSRRTMISSSSLDAWRAKRANSASCPNSAELACRSCLTRSATTCAIFLTSTNSEQPVKCLVSINASCCTHSLHLSFVSIRNIKT